VNIKIDVNDFITEEQAGRAIGANLRKRLSSVYKLDSYGWETKKVDPTHPVVIAVNKLVASTDLDSKYIQKRLDNVINESVKRYAATKSIRTKIDKLVSAAISNEVNKLTADDFEKLARAKVKRALKTGEI
jgi:hypothetical protein